MGRESLPTKFILHRRKVDAKLVSVLPGFTQARFHPNLVSQAQPNILKLKQFCHLLWVSHWLEEFQNQSILVTLICSVWKGIGPKGLARSSMTQFSIEKKPGSLSCTVPIGYRYWKADLSWPHPLHAIEMVPVSTTWEIRRYVVCSLC